MIKKVLLIVPPNITLASNIRRIGEPIGVLSIATYLETKGIDVEVFDMTIEGYENLKYEGDFVIYGSSKEDLEEKIKKCKPDMVGISAMFTSKEKLALNVCETVKNINPNIIIAAGGMPPTVEPLKYIESGLIDYVIMNDGEVRLHKLIENLNNKRQPDFDLDGICYKTSGKTILKNPAKLNEYFGVLPYPKRKFIDMEKLFKIGKPYAPYNQGRRTGHIVASKGCPNNCIFCAAVNFVGKKIHFRTLESLNTEIEELVNKYKIQEIQFMDDNLTANKKFAMELFKSIKKYNLKWCTPNGLFFNSLDDELLETMADSGCYQITLAIESGSERMLKEVIQKHVNLKRVKHIVDKAHSLGLSVHGLFVVGIPGETLEELHQTLDFPFENNFDSVSFSVAQAFKGSRLYEDIEKKGYKIKTQTSVNYKQTNFVIPKNSQDYVISPELLEKTVDETIEKFYDWSKTKFPKIWENKYKKFIEQHTEDEEKVKHRI